MDKKKKLTIMAAVFFGVALIAAGAASAAVGIVGDDPTDTTLAPDPDETPGPEDGTFGQIISALRHEGDHTPAAIVKGKQVPGWDPAKHPGSTTDTIVEPPGHDGDDDGDVSEDDGDANGDDGDDAGDDGTVESDGSSSHAGGNHNSHSQNAPGHLK